LNPNFQAIKECKVLLAVMDNEVASCQKCFEEIKFCRQIETQIIAIEICENWRLSEEVKEIINDAICELGSKGIDCLFEKVARKKLKRTIKDALNRESLGETALIEMMSSEKVLTLIIFNIKL
jgi:hypothetical protein